MSPSGGSRAAARAENRLGRLRCVDARAVLPEPGPHVQGPARRPLRAAGARALPVPVEEARRLRGPGAHSCIE